MTKRKSPAFSFYPNDWFEGTMLMPPIQRAVYIDLLGLQWVRSGFSRDEARLAVRGVSPEDVDAVIASKFVEAKPNWFINERLEAERLKQEERAKNARENGRKGGRPKQKKNPGHNPDGTQKGTQKEPRGEPKHNPEENLSDSVSVSDSVLVLESDSDSGSKGPDSGSSKPDPSTYPDDFETFWKAFPSGRKSKKQDALKAWKKALASGQKPEFLIRRAHDYANSPKGNSEYVQGPTPWLNGGCWDDDPAAWQKGNDTPRNGKQTADEIADEIRREMQQEAVTPTLGGFLQ